MATTYLSTTGKVRANRHPGGAFDVFHNGRKVATMTKEPTGYVVSMPTPPSARVTGHVDFLTAKGLKDVLDKVEKACQS